MIYKKQICSYCGDKIFGKITYLDRPFSKRKGYNTYRIYRLDEGCRLLLEERGTMDDMFMGVVSDDIAENE